MLRHVAAGGVLLAGGYLLGLGVLALAAPRRATRFLSAFAGTRSIHLIELALRALAGAALVARAPHMRCTALVAVLGWTLLGTTGVLLLLPWRWHRRFARWSVPRAVQRLPWIACGSLLGGLLLLAALFTGPSSD